MIKRLRCGDSLLALPQKTSIVHPCSGPHDAMSVAWHLALPPVEIEENWWVNKEKAWPQDKQLDKHFAIFTSEWGGSSLLVFLGMQPTVGGQTSS